MFEKEIKNKIEEVSKISEQATKKIELYQDERYLRLQSTIDYAGVINIAQELIVAFPESLASVHSKLGAIAYFYNKDISKARIHFENSIEVAPDVDYSLRMLARVNEDENNLGNAEKYYKMAFDIPKNFTGKLDLVRFYIRHSKLEKAVEYLGKCSKFSYTTNLGTCEPTALYLAMASILLNDTTKAKLLLMHAFEHTELENIHTGASKADVILSIAIEELRHSRLEPTDEVSITDFIKTWATNLY